MLTTASKACTLFSSPTQHLHHTKCDSSTLLNCQNKMEWSPGFPENVAKSLLERQENRWILERNTAKIYGLHKLRPEQPQNMLMRRDTICFGTRLKFIDRVPHWYVRRAKDAVYIRLHPNNINASAN